MRAMFDQCKLDVSDSVEPADNLALSGKKWRFHTTSTHKGRLAFHEADIRAEIGERR